MNVIWKDENGQLTATGPFVVTCGCGSVVPTARMTIRNAGVPDLPMLISSSNRAVKDYVRQIGLADAIPSLNTGKHAALFNPNTGKFVDMLNVKPTEEYYENIYRVATGQ